MTVVADAGMPGLEGALSVTGEATEATVEVSVGVSVVVTAAVLAGSAFALIGVIGSA